jgi:hypothetical protein
VHMTLYQTKKNGGAAELKRKASLFFFTRLPDQSILVLESFLFLRQGSKSDAERRCSTDHLIPMLEDEYNDYISSMCAFLSCPAGLVLLSLRNKE